MGLPTTLLLDREGREVGRLIGPAEWDSPEMAKFIGCVIARNGAAQSSTESEPAATHPAANAALTFQQGVLIATGNYEGEFLMTLPQSTTTAQPSLGRDVLRAAQYYLGNRWVLLGLGSIAVIAGLSFGGWGWLVAAGLAPVILSTLPCLVMCGFGVCMMCRSGKTQSTTSGDAASSATSSGALGVAKMDGATASGSSCCHDGAGESQKLKQVESSNERTDSHA